MLQCSIMSTKKQINVQNLATEWKLASKNFLAHKTNIGYIHMHLKGWDVYTVTKIPSS